MMKSIVGLLTLLSIPQIVSATPTGGSKAVNTTTCNGKNYVYEELAGYGIVPSTARDKYNDTIGGIGGGIAIDRKTWVKKGSSYTGIIYTIPDRGWTQVGSMGYRNRIQVYRITLTPQPQATVAKPSKPNIQLQYLDTILFSDPNGNPTTALDPDIKGPYLYFPQVGHTVPSVTHTGDGFGGPGPTQSQFSLDTEGLLIAQDGTFWVCDEYGAYLYNFDRSGKLIGAIRPPDAFIPTRNGSVSFSSASAPFYNLTANSTLIPANPGNGRGNLQSLEGLTTNPQGTKLYTLLDLAVVQDNGTTTNYSSNTRLLVYDITKKPAKLSGEYVVHLNKIDPTNPNSAVARQSEIHYISDTQFLVLAHDTKAGRGVNDTNSVYRHVDVFDISKATNIAGKSDCFGCKVTSGNGVLLSNTTAAQYCSWLDYNVNSQLERFGVHNGGKPDLGLLDQKWEGLALAPVNPDARPGEAGCDEYFLFTMTDNDFITQDGYLNGGKFHYKDPSGYALDTQTLAFKIKLPSGSTPLQS